MGKLNTLLIEFESVISKQEKLNIDVSKSNVGWHIEHIFLTTNGVIDYLKKSNPIDYKWSFKMSKFIVLGLKKIPHGRAKAPKKAIPKIYNEQILREHFINVKMKIQELETINKDHFFKHPYFGDLKLNETIKFLEIHADHHLKIIKDILKN